MSLTDSHVHVSPWQAAGLVAGAAGLAWLTAGGFALLRSALRLDAPGLGSNLHRRLYDSALAAEAAVQGVCEETRFVASPTLAKASRASSVHIKMECEQLTGSFKLRGATAAIARLSEADGAPVTASTGNHGKGVCVACSKLLPGVKPRVFAPSTIAPAKLAALKALGADMAVVESDDCEKAEVAAREWAEAHSAVFVSPYNDVVVAGGQGTAALELLRQAEEAAAPPEVVLVPVGGGGLISGIAAVIKARLPGTQVLGCQPASNCCMKRSVEEGRVLKEGEFENGETLSDGTAGGIEEGSFTLQACRELVDGWLLAEEDAILDGMAVMLREHGRVVEGAAGVAVACLLDPRNRWLLEGKRVAVVACGGNASPALVARVAKRAAELP